MGHSDRPVRDCEHLTVHHDHGTQAGYTQDGCRCTPCTAANTVAKRQHRAAVTYGTRQGLVDATPVRQHLHALRAAGFSLHQIAHATGVAQGTINALVYGSPVRNLPPSEQVRADTAQRLLTWTPAPNALPSGSRIPATGTRRRLQALACLGWSMPALAERTTITRRTLTRLLTGSTTTVTAGTASTLAALYERLRLAPPPQATPRERVAAREAAAAAQAAGWRGPHTWHDIDHDPKRPQHGRARLGRPEPAQDYAEPLANGGWDDLDQGSCHLSDAADIDEVAVERAMRGEQLRLNRDERREVVARLTRRGVSAREIADRLHTTSRTVVRLRGALRDTSAA